MVRKLHHVLVEILPPAGSEGYFPSNKAGKNCPTSSLQCVQLFRPKTGDTKQSAITAVNLLESLPASEYFSFEAFLQTE